MHKIDVLKDGMNANCRIVAVVTSRLIGTVVAEREIFKEI